MVNISQNLVHTKAHTITGGMSVNTLFQYSFYNNCTGVSEATYLQWAERAAIKVQKWKKKLRMSGTSQFLNGHTHVYLPHPI